MTALKLEDARRVISAAEKKARELGQPINIAVAMKAETSDADDQPKLQERKQ